MRPLFPLALLAATCLAGVVPAGAVSTATGSPAYLTEIEGTQALAWVKAHNTQTLSTLQADPHYQPLFQQALALAQDRDRIPAPSMIAGQVYNFWQDSDHVRGIWRRTSLDSYRSAAPAWSTVIDLDALSASEHANWVWKGADCAEPTEHLCLVHLSDGGEDAVTLREFDLSTGGFVKDGFSLSRAKQEVAWVDDDTLLIARDWGLEHGHATVTPSSYAFVVKQLKRGQALGQATEIYRGKPTDMSVAPTELVDGDGHRVSLITRAVSFFEFEFRVMTPHGLVLLDLPKKATVEGLVANRLIVKIDQDWTPKGSAMVTAGSLVSLDAGHPDAPPMVIFKPTDRQSMDTVSVSRDRVVAGIYDNVRGQAWVFTPADAGWTARRLALPDNVSIDVADSNIHDENTFFDVTGFLSPTQLWLADAATGTATTIKSQPAKFDAAPYAVDQYEAVSTDGTKVPYFVVHRRDLKTDGSNPTLLYAYGGFQVSMTPTYSGALGKLWLDRGGVYVLANIRGGGEFGPRWHEAGVQTKRQHVFDDFASVGRDLIARKITSPDRLGIRGGSNGGLLMGVEFTQHPELWKAVIIDVPLLDMMNFETMSAGASWVGEYGSVHVPAQRRFLAGMSPLQNLKAGVKYPEPFIFTTTKDDRVGPVHARRFAARMEAMGLPFLYFEQTEGGHAAGANLVEKAEEQALEFTYLTRKLMP
ncbi:S9 family peptidase [Lichenicola cladoniae]|uniref:S9 family peptidase n=1 Tax=Lichenicola cladoniae TaxID=1484109 RepID=A0A6M8HR69_9PROT|nr:prolyl oligopeptidase family serine peptidase [Lichenicola cladoniae]NPD68806.1 S9 family peptidase [Acetobacteraceae bacterium]QKE90775.1 S9 family peptidase [Lichenicola cladoniae]